MNLLKIRLSYNFPFFVLTKGYWSKEFCSISAIINYVYYCVTILTICYVTSSLLQRKSIWLLLMQHGFKYYYWWGQLVLGVLWSKTDRSTDRSAWVVNALLSGRCSVSRSSKISVRSWCIIASASIVMLSNGGSVKLGWGDIKSNQQGHLFCIQHHFTMSSINQKVQAHSVSNVNVYRHCYVQNPRTK